MIRTRASLYGSLAATAALSVSGLAAEPGGMPVEPKPLSARLNPFTPSIKPAAAAPVKPSPNMPVAGPLSAETLNDVLRVEQEAYTRRLEVCTQLRIVASKANDDNLASQADELERLAEITYKTRIARVGVKSNLRNNSAGDDLDRSIGSTMTATPGSMGMRSPADARPTVAQVRNFREVKP